MLSFDRDGPIYRFRKYRVVTVVTRTTRVPSFIHKIIDKLLQDTNENEFVFSFLLQKKTFRYAIFSCSKYYIIPVETALRSYGFVDRIGKRKNIFLLKKNGEKTCCTVQLLIFSHGFSKRFRQIYRLIPCTNRRDKFFRP